MTTKKQQEKTSQDSASKEKDEKVIQDDPGQGKNTSSGIQQTTTSGKPYKRKHQLTKKDVKEIIEWNKNSDISVKDVVNKYGCSLSSVNKLFRILRKGYIPLSQEDQPPKGYVVPRNLDETINSVLYDMGFKR